ncbi:uncharacterized protein HMPREF1541_04283 [Cyphellophora europaea CBS 101466]|uniref:ferric-chelate reductase (NADPH) n=1 Tax=Cyphellophora europaea (strain CBS 101466) TaxID=1220924 RepID=W2RW74_CYPE1|nr:uncharacterized protein HMPREF1541_04283 [Cyphellophora europaea CBS 101466]ETN40008.1 hypothetical protein HMPREF1541_04283 [Cyphellophora europaea CBS 101466]
MALNARHEGHSMSGMSGMSGMGGMNMPSYTDIQHYFWIFTGSIIAFAMLINILNFLLFRQRLSSLSARPISILATSYAVVTAITRELSQVSLPVYHFKQFKLRTPPLGPTFLVLAWLAAILSFSFYGYDTFDQRQWEDIAYRVGSLAVAELPLIFLLAGKQNLIGYAIGSSYERLNWLHRWVSRVFWVTVTIHMSFWFRSWARYNYIVRKLQIDRLTQTGFACWVILTAILLTSFLPVRKLSHEVFYALHVVLFAGLMGAIYLHLENSRVYFWVSVAIFFIDRVLRLCVTAWANIPLLHGRSQVWANNATLTPLPGNVTRLTIENPVISWSPGQHMFVSCHSLVPLQAHPFTAASLPSDGKLEFLVQAQKGGTRRLHRWAAKTHLLPNARPVADVPQQTKFIGLEGPYGAHRPLHQFSSVLLFAGSTGATFTMPLMRDIVRRWVHNEATVTRHIKFVWVIKAQNRLCWFQDVLERALQDVVELRANDGREVELEVSVYVTCDEELEAMRSSESGINGNTARVCAPREHGEAEIAPFATAPVTEDTGLLGQKANKPSPAVQEVTDDEKKGCGPDGGCCCKQAVSEDGIESAACTCCNPVDSSSSSSSSSPPSYSEKAQQPPHPHSHSPPMSNASLIKLHTGRPRIRPLMRALLEDAEGESAVLACGPQGLQDDVRRSAVALSDERAIHKGTGAQGLYLHLEGFGY